MRPIDADALIAKEERRELDKYIDGERCYEMVVPTWAIYEAPTIDAVEVVRCKECKHRYETGVTFKFYGCDFLDAEYHDNGFCSYGERKDNGRTDTEE